VVVRDVKAEVIDRAALAVDGISRAYRRLPDFALSADLVQSYERSADSFRPLEIPHFEIHLDCAPVVMRPAWDSNGGPVREVRPFPLTVPASEEIRLVFAPITDDQRWVRWRFLANIECDGLTASPTWQLTVTAETKMAIFRPHAKPEWASVRQFYPDHWQVRYRMDKYLSRGESPELPVPHPSETAEKQAFSTVAHTTADGNFLILGRPASPPEPPDAATCRERAEQYEQAGRLVEAQAAYRAAAAAGSADAAYRLGVLLHRSGDQQAAQRWYQQAADQDFPLAFNNLGALALARGDLTQAEAWFRRAIDIGDWVAAGNLATILANRGETDRAQQWWRLAASNGVAEAAHNLALELNQQGRSTEAEQWWHRAAERLDPAAVPAAPYPTLGDAWSAPLVDDPAQSAEVQSAYRLGHLLYQRGEKDAANHWWTLAARAGHAGSAYWLARAWNERGDHSQVLYWLRAAVNSETAPPPLLKKIADELPLSADQTITVPAEMLDDAIQFCSVAVAAYRRLHTYDNHSYREEYARTLDDLARLHAMAGDAAMAAATENELARIRPRSSDPAGPDRTR
jgi:Flp pilus assembly protein TadD